MSTESRHTLSVAEAWWPIDRPIPYDRNPNGHPEAQLDKYEQSIRQNGWTKAIGVDKDGVIVRGQGAWMTAKRAGWEQVPVKVLDYLSDDEIRAYRLLDNRLPLDAEIDEGLLAGEMDLLREAEFNLAMTGFDEKEIDQLLASVHTDLDQVDVDAEEVPDPPKEPATQLGDLWMLGDHRLLCGSCTDEEAVARLMDGQRAQLFQTDPPYLVNYDGTNHPAGHNKDWSDAYGDKWDDADEQSDLYPEFMAIAIAVAIEPHVPWFCWHASTRRVYLEATWGQFGVQMHQQIIWYKDRPVMTHSEMMWDHEPCLFGWVRPGRPKRYTKQRLRTVWEVPGLAGEERPEHPTPKPPELFARPMRQYTKKGDICYEPFSGSGSQIIAGEEMGRRVFATEIAPHYIDVTIHWWQKRTGHEAVLEGAGRTFREIAEERAITSADNG